MKKTTLAIAIIAGLGILWTGGAYYTGQKAETELQALFEKDNQEIRKVLATSGIPLQIANTNLKFERGIFSSDISYDLEITAENGEKTVLPFSGAFYHGPLPLNLVKKFNFVPAMFSVDAALLKNVQTEKWFANNSHPFTTELTFGYDKNFKGKFISKLNGVIHEKAKLTLDMEAVSEGNYKQAGKINLNIKEFNIQNTELNDMDVLTLNDAKVEINGEKPAGNLKYLANSSIIFNAEKIALNTIDAEGEKISFNTQNAEFKYQLAVKDQFVDYALAYKLDKINVNGIDIGKLQSDMEANHIDANAPEKSLDNYLIYHGEVPPSVSQEIGLAVISNEPQLKEKGFKFERESGQFTADLDIHLAKLDLAKLNQNANLLGLFKNFTINASLDKALFLDVISQVAQQEEQLTKEEADKQAQAMLDNLIHDGVKNNIIVEDGNKLKLNAKIEGEYLNVNGQKISNQELQGMLFLLMLGMGNF